MPAIEEYSDDVESPAHVPTLDLPRALASSGNIAFESHTLTLVSRRIRYTMMSNTRERHAYMHKDCFYLFF